MSDVRDLRSSSIYKFKLCVHTSITWNTLQTEFFYTLSLGSARFQTELDANNEYNVLFTALAAACAAKLQFFAELATPYYDKWFLCKFASLNFAHACLLHIIDFTLASWNMQTNGLSHRRMQAIWYNWRRKCQHFYWWHNTWNKSEIDTTFLSLSHLASLLPHIVGFDAFDLSDHFLPQSNNR